MPLMNENELARHRFNKEPSLAGHLPLSLSLSPVSTLKDPVASSCHDLGIIFVFSGFFISFYLSSFDLSRIV